MLANIWSVKLIVGLNDYMYFSTYMYAHMYVLYICMKIGMDGLKDAWIQE